LGLIIVTNSGIGFAQEYKSEKTMDALRKMTSPNALVLKGSEWVLKPANTLVPGDICRLEAGVIIF
jgi:magnesium-transporting ATPase (P-type)